MSKIATILSRATDAGRVEWSFVRDTIDAQIGTPQYGRTGIVGAPLYCLWSDSCFRLYEYRFKYFVDEDAFEWSHSVALELASGPAGVMLDDLGGDSDVLWDLLKVARAQAAGVDSLAQRLEAALNAEDEEPQGPTPVRKKKR